MKRLALVGLVSLVAVVSVKADVYVNGYLRQDGTYVQPHMRTSPDSNPYNNKSYNKTYNYRYGR